MEQETLYRWVKASDGNPEKSGMYIVELCTVEDGLTFRPACYEYYNEQKGKWNNEQVYQWLCQVTPHTEDRKFVTVTILDELNNWVNASDRETIHRKDFFNVAQKIAASMQPKPDSPKSEGEQGEG